MGPSPIRRIRGPTKICYDCEPEMYPNGKIIFDDPLAKQDRKGKWHYFIDTYIHRIFIGIIFRI